MPSNNRTRQFVSTPKGFSLVEVVVVVTLMGMATAFAIPRFTSLGNRTRAAEVVVLSANLREAAQIAHAQFVASGSTSEAAKLKGKSVTLKNGYPDATPNGIGNAIIDWGGFTTKTTTSFVTFFKTGAPVDAQCSVTYKAASAPSVAATVTELDIAGC